MRQNNHSNTSFIQYTPAQGRQTLDESRPPPHIASQGSTVTRSNSIRTLSSLSWSDEMTETLLNDLVIAARMGQRTNGWEPAVWDRAFEDVKRCAPETIRSQITMGQVKSKLANMKKGYMERQKLVTLTGCPESDELAMKEYFDQNPQAAKLKRNPLKYQELLHELFSGNQASKGPIVEVPTTSRGARSNAVETSLAAQSRGNRRSPNEGFTPSRPSTSIVPNLQLAKPGRKRHRYEDPDESASMRLAKAVEHHNRLRACPTAIESAADKLFGADLGFDTEALVAAAMHLTSESVAQMFLRAPEAVMKRMIEQWSQQK